MMSKKSRKPQRLTERQLKFVRAFKELGNGTQAAVAAGYSEKTAQEQASRLLSNVMVQEALHKVEEKLQAKHEVTLDRIVQELSAIAFGHSGNILDWDDKDVKLKSKSEMSDAELRFVDGIQYSRHMQSTGKFDNEGNEIMEPVVNMRVTTLAKEKVKSLELMAKLLGLDRGDQSEKTKLMSVFQNAIEELKNESK